MTRRTYAAALLAGIGMAVGLALGRLTRPEVIIGWVDFFGRWDPTMLVFFAFGLFAYHLTFRWARGRERSGVGPALSLPAARVVDKRLIIGASIFGAGWGLGGVCPGPGFTSLGAGTSWAIPYVAALALGIMVVDLEWLGGRAGVRSMWRRRNARETPLERGPLT